MNKSLLLTLALATAGTTLLAEQDARADVRVHVGGHVRVHVGGGTRVHYRVYRPRPRPVRVHVGGAIWVGGGTYYGPRFAEPPPSYSYCDCDDGGYYGPVRPAPSGAVVQSAPRAPLPRWGLGVAAGGVSVEGQDAGSDLSLLGRYRLTPGLSIEGEIGKNELADGNRVDRRLGASLVYELGAYNRWAPYGVAGLGVSQVDVGGGDYQSDQRFAEIGVGLRLALSRRIHVAADIRAGSRDQIGGDDNAGVAFSSAPPADESEEYTRMRLSGILFF